MGRSFHDPPENYNETLREIERQAAEAARRHTEERERIEAEAQRLQREADNREREAKMQQDELNRLREETKRLEHEARRQEQEARRREVEARDEEIKKARAQAEQAAHREAELQTQLKKKQAEAEEVRRREVKARDEEIKKARAQTEQAAHREAELQTQLQKKQAEAEEVRRREVKARDEAIKKARAQAEQAAHREAELQIQIQNNQAKAEEARKLEAEAREAMNQALQDLSIGKQPEMTPTMEDIIKAKKRVQYNNENFHFAICGTAGSGKSSMINAIRGVTPKHPQAAKTGVTETTMDIGRYPDPSKEPPRSRFVWYDIPGAGTQKIKGWQYFNNQGLYVFDFVIVLVDNRFTELEVEILKNCHRMGIPCFIVRSKADQHIANIEKEQAMDEEDYEEDYEDIGEDPHKCTQPTAREQYIAQTRESIAKNLEEAGLPPQYVYLISNRALLRAMPKGKMDAAKNLISNFTTSSDAIDEDKMVRDMINTARARRYREAISVG